MTRKLSFSLRWSIVFVVLGFFTFYSLTAYALLGNNDKVYAQNINNDNNMSDKDHFVAVDDEGDDWKDERGNRLENQKWLCAINQTQLDAIKTQFNAKVKDVKTDHKTVKVAEVVKTKSVNKHTIYSALGIDEHSCKVVQQHRSFLLFLLPGVS